MTHGPHLWTLLFLVLYPNLTILQASILSWGSSRRSRLSFWNSQVPQHLCCATYQIIMKGLSLVRESHSSTSPSASSGKESCLIHSSLFPTELGMLLTVLFCDGHLWELHFRTTTRRHQNVNIYSKNITHFHNNGIFFKDGWAHIFEGQVHLLTYGFTHITLFLKYM